jgi:hypothetical protein
MHKYKIQRYDSNYKIFKCTQTCFRSQTIHHQVTLYSTLLKLQERFCCVRWRGRWTTYTIGVTIRCHNADHVHVNGHERTILVILAKYCTRLPDDGSFVIQNMLRSSFKYFIILIVSMNYIFVRKLDNKIFNCEATWHFIYMRQFNDHFMWRLKGIYHASKVRLT